MAHILHCFFALSNANEPQKRFLTQRITGYHFAFLLLIRYILRSTWQPNCFWEEKHMASRVNRMYHAWIRQLRHLWKPLAWMWGVLIVGVIVNDGSSWLFSKSFDVSCTPLGCVIWHPGVTLPLLCVLIL